MRCPDSKVGICAGVIDRMEINFHNGSGHFQEGAPELIGAALLHRFQVV